jgi:histidine triad (HIT) family protein
MSDCIFCRIVSGEVPARVVHQTDHALVIRDAQPQAPVHLLVLPREHVVSLNEAAPDLIAQLYAAGKAAATRLGFAERGYRTVINVLSEGGQTVWHLHLHILAGRAMRWPPG